MGGGRNPQEGLLSGRIKHMQYFLFDKFEGGKQNTALPNSSSSAYQESIPVRAFLDEIERTIFGSLAESAGCHNMKEDPGEEGAMVVKYDGKQNRKQFNRDEYADEGCSCSGSSSAKKLWTAPSPVAVPLVSEEKTKVSSEAPGHCPIADEWVAMKDLEELVLGSLSGTHRKEKKVQSSKLA